MFGGDRGYAIRHLPTVNYCVLMPDASYLFFFSYAGRSSRKAQLRGDGYLLGQPQQNPHCMGGKLRTIDCQVAYAMRGKMLA